MLDKEKILKEQRVSQAVDKNYMGLDGKFGIILKYLGKPIMMQGTGAHEETEWEDVYNLRDEDELPTEDLDAPIREIGKLFDGLKFGHHIEITYLKEGSIPIKIDDFRTVYEEAFKVLKVTYKGYIVYLEAEGDLHVFTPSSEWEDIVTKIYQSAEKIKNQFRMDTSLIAQAEAKKEKLSFLERLRERWGI